MGFFSHSLATVALLFGSAPFTSGRSLPERHTFIPRQATPGFSGCSYPSGWQSCNSADNRGCWVRDPSGKEYNINSNYEADVPSGIERTYDIEITEKEISPDGVPKPLAKLINGEYPGQVIEGCWGDTLIVNVKNSLPDNGTTIHWHGVRQKGSNEMDGVNGVTMCPTAEGDTFTYKFRLTQYGTSWYHSHYSSQYPDGVAAPLLIHGPNSANWDEEWSPIIITDWLHKSAFEEFHKELAGPPLPIADSILVNGTGRFNGGGSYFNQKFEAGKRYLIRLINGSAGTHFIFSIDNHNLQVIATDFVPIRPYNTTSLSIGIGQRYDIIVEAKPDTESANGKYWLRTEFADATTGCNNGIAGAGTQDLQRTGIISYPNATGNDDPRSSRHAFTVHCNEEPGDKTIPILPWTVSEPQNNITRDTYRAGLHLGERFHGFLRWDITSTPMWLNFSDPTILNLDNTTWNPEYAVIDYDYKDEGGFVYIVITSGSIGNDTVTKIPSFHPIHLHGHDVAVLAQEPTAYDPTTSPANFKFTDRPRRDVVMLPNGGFIALAFKPDNPGSWLLHCHIAWHAGSGLALQILERQGEIEGANGPLDQQRQGCQKWDAWLATHKDVFDPVEDQEDSGI